MRPLTATLLFLCACHRPDIEPKGDTGDTAPVADLSDAVYDPDHIVRVEIEMAPDDWDALRSETRDFLATLGEGCQEQPFENPFDWFSATVTLEGQRFDEVGVRKKGFLGSLSEIKPALKVDLDEYGGTATFWGVSKLTFNNAVSDPSYLRQCLGYGFFRDAGLPASRCNYARIAVNGQDLGVYVNVEPIKDDMLARHFADTSGNLYEGTLSDFREGWTGTFDKKSNEDEDDWSDIAAMVEAVQVEDDVLLDTLDPILDIDAFLSHWAAEVVVAHLDGYASNTNNFYLYADPADGRLHFLPWGIDELLSQDSADYEPASVYANGILAQRLYLLPESQERYRARLREFLDGPWNEELLLGRIDHDLALLQPELGIDEGAVVTDAAEILRDVVSSRRPAIQEELDGSAPEWPFGLRSTFCFDQIGDMEATFSTTWGSVETSDPFTNGEGWIRATIEGDTSESSNAGAVAGISDEENVLYVAAWISDTEAMVAWYQAPEAYFAQGTFDIDFGERVGALFYLDTETMEDFEVVGYVLGEITFEEGGTEAGDPLVGRISGELMTWQW